MQDILFRSLTIKTIHGRKIYSTWEKSEELLFNNKWVPFQSSKCKELSCRPHNRDVSLCDRFNKLTSVFHASVLLLTINCVITLSKWLWNQEHYASGFTVNFGNVITQFIINKKTDA